MEYHGHRIGITALSDMRHASAMHGVGDSLICHVPRAPGRQRLWIKFALPGWGWGAISYLEANYFHLKIPKDSDIMGRADVALDYPESQSDGRTL